jgi:26S proteasome regulatory subunit N5
LQEVHVETYGSLSKRDKVEFILEQMRLTLAKKDYVRAHIVAGKISRKNLMEENMEEFKVKFFTLLAEYHRYFDQDAFELAKDYHAIYSTPHILADESKWMPALQATVLFLSLSQYGNEQQDMLHRINLDSNLEKLPACKMTIQLFLKKEIIHYPLPHQAELEATASFQEAGLASHWHDVFHRRVIQHNVRIVSIYYKRIHGRRLAQLLQLDPVRLEQEIASMVSDGSIAYIKIDRPKDIVRFAAPKSPELVLSDWVADIDKLLHLVDSTTHLINKENMTA